MSSVPASRQCDVFRHSLACGVAVPVARHRRAAIVRGRTPDERHLFVARRRRQRRERARPRHRRGQGSPRFAFAHAVARPHLEGVLLAIGQSGDRPLEVQPGGLPRRVPRYRGARRKAVLVAGDGRAAIVRGLGPLQDDLAVAPSGRERLGHTRHAERRGRRPRRRTGAGAVHRPHLERVLLAVRQARHRFLQIEARVDPSPAVVDRILVPEDRGTAVARRGIPGQHHLLVARHPTQVLRRAGRGEGRPRHLRRRRAVGGARPGRDHPHRVFRAVGEAGNRVARGRPRGRDRGLPVAGVVALSARHPLHRVARGVVHRRPGHHQLRAARDDPHPQHLLKVRRRRWRWRRRRRRWRHSRCLPVTSAEARAVVGASAVRVAITVYAPVAGIEAGSSGSS